MAPPFVPQELSQIDVKLDAFPKFKKCDIGSIPGFSNNFKS